MYDISYIKSQISLSPRSTDRDGLVCQALEQLENFEPYTAAHSHRVGSIAGVIASELGYSTTEVRLITASGHLHDIGKVGLSLDALQKPSALSDEEYLEVQKHPELGFEILKECPALKELIPGVLYHHERFDGGGYPFGLRGDQIPLIARVIAVADAYDAMTSTRSYRVAMSHQHAIEELERGRLKQFDPMIIDAALNSTLDRITSASIDCVKSSLIKTL